MALLAYNTKEAINHSLDLREQRAVQKIKSNPKVFYSYAKSFSAVKSSIHMFLNDSNEVVTDAEQMANLFQDQFRLVFSDPNSSNIQPPAFEPPVITKTLTSEDFLITVDDILASIGDLKSDSAAGPDGIPVILLKNCATQLCEPLRILWSESFQTGVVPLFYKSSYITPIFKRGERARAVNYRPISLTSHVIKIYERVLRKTMVNFIEDNNILCDNQHGFRSGRSCLAQMLSHFDDIMLGLLNGHGTDAIYLDFAKAFDKVDHKLLLEKLKLYGLPQQLIK